MNNQPSFLKTNELRLLLFGGKGGVGKTTSALATGIHLAQSRPAEKFLLVSTDPAHSLNDGLKHQADYPPNLLVRELDARISLERFKTQHAEKLREIARRGTFLDDGDINQFLDLSLPGMDELMAFLEISEWAAGNEYACIIVDTAPTGHTLRLLGMPELLRRWLGMLDALLAKQRYMKQLFAGRYRRDELDEFLESVTASVHSLDEALRDTARTRFVPVMIAETMSTQETLALIAELETLHIPVSEIIINRIVPQSDCTFCQQRSLRQQHALGEFLSTRDWAGYSFWQSPLSASEITGVQQLHEFWQRVTPYVPADSTLPDSVGGFALIPPHNPALLPGPQAKFLIFAGKGGVGKTTLACTTAIRMAQEYPERELLLFSTDPAHSLSDCVNVRIGAQPVRLMPGLSAIEIDAQAEFDRLKAEYAVEVEKFFSTTFENLDLEFDREVMERVLDLAPPGLDEVMALLRVMELARQEKYDAVILDSAPTGHLIRLMEMPELIDQWLKTFFGLFLKYKHIFRLPRISQLLVEMSKNLKKLRSTLHDPTQASLYAVSIPTDMAFEETRDLVTACEKLRLEVAGIFINLVTPPSACDLCHAVVARETGIIEKFAEEFRGASQTLIPAQSDLAGMTALSALGISLYQHALTKTVSLKN